MTTGLFDPCPVCGTILKRRAAHYGDRIYFDCPRCGLFGLTGSAEALLPEMLAGSRRNAAILSRAIFRTPPKGQDTKLFDVETCKRLIDTGDLPTPHELADNLVRWLGENLAGPGDKVKRLDAVTHANIIGVQSEEDFETVVVWLQGQRLIWGHIQHRDYQQIGLTFAGWARFEELKRGAPTGRNAFMAMPYGNDVLDRIVADYFLPAVKQTGFDLKRLDDEPKAGLIDARMLLRIQEAWFLVADVTDANPGAYWEAGYAFGLHKPVIYTCEKSVWNERKSHFDTNHHLHVLWEAADMTAAVRDLKATIRFTLPEAKQRDDS